MKDPLFLIFIAFIFSVLFSHSMDQKIRLDIKKIDAVNKQLKSENKQLKQEIKSLKEAFNQSHQRE